MPRLSCHACLEKFEAPVGASNCPICGIALAGKAGWVVGKRDLRCVARIQRTLLWFMLLLIVSQTLFAVSPIPLANIAFIVIYFGLLVTVVVSTVRLSGALGDHLVMRIICAVFMFAPCINLLLLLMVNQRATKALRKAGLRVGFMGVRDEDVVRFLGVNRCHGCGYNLTGNVSGRCPECGTPVGEAGDHAHAS